MGTLYVVATPIGNLGDFSLRAQKTLEESDLILVEDTRQTIKLLNYFNIKTKMVSYHKFNEIKRTEEIIKELKSGKNISLVSDAGTPCISDPGYILVKEAKENGINVIGIPGASAVITSLSISGLDTSSFVFFGFVPTENKQKKELFERIKHSDVKTKVVYESPKRVLKFIEELKEEIPGCVVSICSELTKIYEKCDTGKIEDIYQRMIENKQNIKGEYVILISNEQINEKKQDISLEALIIDEVIKNNCSIKEAINIVNNKNKDINKKQIYNASLNLKKVIK